MCYMGEESECIVWGLHYTSKYFEVGLHGGAYGGSTGVYKGAVQVLTVGLYGGRAVQGCIYYIGAPVG